MARPIKNNADYFSHDNDMRDDERIKAVRRRFSHLGYSTWNMLLERLCRAEDFKIEYNEDSMDLMAGDFNIEPEQLKEIIDYLIKLKLIIKDGEIIFSQTMINRFEGLFRKRKRDAERLSLTITKDKSNIADENAQSKVKQSKVKKRKVNKTKEKGSKEIQPPIFLNSFLKNELEEKNESTKIQEEKNPEEKTCEKKEIPDAVLVPCKNIFLKQSPYYVWEQKDSEYLGLLLQKIIQTKKSVRCENDLIESFSSLLQKLPEYWRTKKFTITNLNYNYNEIVNEISANNQVKKTKIQNQIQKPRVLKPPEIKIEPTDEEKKKIHEDFKNTICECFENFVLTGEYGYLPRWVMYQTLVDEGVLKLTAKKISQYKNMALDKRMAELKNPKTPHEERTFAEILENFDEQTEQGEEKNRIEIEVKSLAVQGLFEELKKKKIDLKTLLKN